MFDASPRPELLALLAAVKAAPDDDTPKLVLADWLQEQDTETDRARGDFLRLLVEFHRLPEDNPGHDHMEVHVNDLWTRYAREWVGSLTEAGFRFRSLGCTHPEWGLPYPFIDGSKVVTKKAAAVAGSEAFAWVAGLSFPRMGGIHLTAFARSPLFDSLIGLTLQNCGASETSIASLVYSPKASGLKSLQLGKVAAPIAAIADSASLTGLRDLGCWFCQAVDRDFKLLCDCPHLNELRTLNMSNNRLTIHSARAFIERQGLPALTELNLGGTNYIGPDGTLLLVSSPRSEQLRKLNLWSNRIADYGVEAICRQPHMCNLTDLDVSGNLLTNRAAAAIANAEHLKSLEVLNLRTNGISNEGALALAKSPHLDRIRRLDLGANRIGENGLAALRDRFGNRVIVE